LSEAQAEQKFEQAITAYRKKHHLEEHTRIFKVLGGYNDIRINLINRGWVEHEAQKEGENFVSNAFHLLYSVKAKDCFRIPDVVPQFQHMNHFEGTKGLTTKVGLTHNMKNLIWRHNMDIDLFFPQSYDLSDMEGDELKDFLQDFKFAQIVSFLKQITSTPQQIPKNMDKILICLGICERRVRILGGEGVFREKELGTDFECGLISDDIHHLIAENKVYTNYNITPWFRKLQKQYKDLNS